MQLPNIKRDQLRLFPEPLGNHGTVRTTIGDFAELLVAKLLGGYRYRTDSSVLYCPDVVVKDMFFDSLDKYFEVKAVGRTRHTFIYKGRLEKDKEFAKDNDLYYVLCCHSVDSSVCRDSFELQSLFLATLYKILLVPFSTVYEAAKMSAVTKLNSRYGHSDTNPIYGEGYRIPIKRFDSFYHLEIAVNYKDSSKCR